jgi:AraC-like DNA-binding protein
METLFNSGFDSPDNNNFGDTKPLPPLQTYTKYVFLAVMSLRDYIDDHPFEFKTVPQLLDHLKTPNRSLVGKAFKSEFGVSINRYMIKQRLQRAKYALTQNIPIKIVSYRCLYESVSSFDTAFKKEFGITPTQWERMYLAQRAKEEAEERAEKAAKKNAKK